MPGRHDKVRRWQCLQGWGQAKLCIMGKQDSSQMPQLLDWYENSSSLKGGTQRKFNPNEITWSEMNHMWSRVCVCHYCMQK